MIVLEPLSLYEIKDEVPDIPGELVLGRASRKRTGTDVTIVTWGAMVPRVLEAADTLAADGVSCDVLDLITLTPWDVGRGARIGGPHRAGAGRAPGVPAQRLRRRGGGRRSASEASTCWTRPWPGSAA